jgi:hypothetical protein
MVEKILWKNAINAKYLIGAIAAGTCFLQYAIYRPGLLHLEVFGIDGNGGKMLKIITNLTDEEIARLKFVRRMHWHWRGSRKLSHGKDTIQTPELTDRGIPWNENVYIEYEKRPPHDKYL